MTMGMSYRYIFLLLETVQNTFTAIKSRVGFVASAKQGRGVVASNMAGLWLKSYRLHAQVYQAMISRGYTGEPKTLDDFTATIGDILFAAAAGAIFIGTLWLNHFTH
jgi:cobalt/nickel transport system permease protein